MFGRAAGAPPAGAGSAAPPTSQDAAARTVASVQVAPGAANSRSDPPRRLIVLSPSRVARPRPPVIPDRPIPPAALASLGASHLPDRRALAEEILSRWQDLEHAPEPSFLWPEVGDRIRWEGGEGTCEGWAEDGRLRVRTGKGVELLSVGDVSGLRV